MRVSFALINSEVHITEGPNYISQNNLRGNLEKQLKI